jgi:hypothetical protein
LQPSPASAQFGYGGGGFRGLRGIKQGLVGNRADFSFCRLAYNSVTREAGGQGWSTDYPGADENFMFRMEELTTIMMSKYPDGEFAYSIMNLADPDIYRCGFLFASDVGTMGLHEAESAKLRDWLEKGGFLWVDDFWGDLAWDRWTREILRVLPGKTIVDLTPEHPIFNMLYHVRKIPQIPSINHWRRSGKGTSERGFESETPEIRAIFDDRGRIMVLMSHDTDIADGWEREAEDDEYFYLFSPDAYAIAANVIVWAMTH